MPGIVESFYDGRTQYEWGRLNVHRTEFAVSLRAMQDHLPPPPAEIADIGGGPGRYAIELARRGYRVTLVDLSRNCLEWARERAAEAGVSLTSTVHANATDLHDLKPNNYDAVLLMGPLYHLLAEHERQKAVDEARRILKSGGLIFATFIGRFAGVLNAARIAPQWIVRDREECETLLSTGIHRANGDQSRFPDAYFIHPTDIKAFMGQSGFAARGLIGCEGVTNTLDDKVNDFRGALWEAWVEMNYRLGKDPAVHGASDHLLYIGHKCGQ